MANVRISQLPAAPAPIDGSELVPIVQNGQTVQTTVNDLISSPSLTQTFLTKVQEPSLPNSRYVGVGNGLSISDAGAQNLLQISPAGALASLVTSSTGIQVKTDATTLTNRSIATSGNGLSVSNGSGVSGDPTLSLSGLPATLANTVGTGLLAIGASTTLTPVTVTGTSNQITVANGDGSGGNPTISLADNPVIPGTAAMQIPAGTTAERPLLPVDGDIRYNTDTGRFEFYDAGWFNVGTGDGNISSVAGTANQIVVVNGSTAPVISIDPDPTIPGSAGMVVPFGTTAQRSGGPNGTLRYNTDTETFEGYANGAWGSITTGTGVTSVGTGTGLTGGPITSTGTISIADTTVTAASYGSAANVATFAVNAQGQLTAAADVAISIPASAINTTIPNSGLTNSSITIGSTSVSLGGTITTLTGTSISGSTNTLTNIGNSSLTNSSVTFNGVNVALGGSGTITATTTAALSAGTGLQFSTGSTFDGSVARTITIDSSVATLTGAQVLTNKSISGSSNTLTNIGNSSLTNSTIVLGTTTIALGGTELAPAGLTSVTVTQDPVSAFQLATKQYVDTIATTGIDYHAPVKYEVPLINLNATYNNGAAGVGATLTNAGTLTAFTPDGTVASVGDRVLVYNQTNQFENGVYTVTTVGSGSVAWVLTRATDADTWGVNNPNKLDQGSAFFVTSGATGAGETYVCNTTGTITFGTTAITFVQISDTQIYSAGTGLTLSGTQFSISNTAVTAGSYGSATQVGTFTVNAQGQLTLAGNTTVTPAVGSITGLGTGVATALAVNVGTAGAVVVNGGALGTPSSGTLTNATGLPVSTGISGLGTGVATALAVNVGTAGAFVVNGGALGTPSSGTLTNATGLPLTTGVTGTLPVGNGGTGATTLTGYVKGNGTSAFTASATIPSGDITGLGTMATQNANSVAITGGAIDGTTVGATTATTGKFTVLTATSDSSFTSTGALLISKGTTAQQPGTPVTGMLRYNTTTNQFEGYSGSSAAWNPVGGASISNDTSTASNLYPIFANATTGSATTVYTSNAKYLYKPSTGELQSSVLAASNGIVVNSQTISTSYTIAAGYSGSSAGPVTVASGVTVTVSSGSRWVVL